MPVNYPFKIVVDTMSGSHATFYSETFASSSESFVSSSDIVSRIGAMISHSSEFPFDIREPGDRDTGILFGNYAKNPHLSASFTEPESGSVVFHDRELEINGYANNDLLTGGQGGVKGYRFFGEKVCKVLGLPEGITIRPENFKLSDDDTDPDNYFSGDITATNVNVAERFYLAPGARVKGSLILSEEGDADKGVIFESASLARARFAFNEISETYELAGGTDLFDGNTDFNISASNLRVKRNITGRAASSVTASFGHLEYTTRKNPLSNPSPFITPYILRSGFNVGSSGTVIIPLGPTGDAVSDTVEFSQFIAPCDMEWISAKMISENDPGVTVLMMMKIADGTENSTVVSGAPNASGMHSFCTFTSTAANTVLEGSAPSLNAGGGTPAGEGPGEIGKNERFEFQFDPTNTPDDVTIILSFMLNPYTFD